LIEIMSVGFYDALYFLTLGWGWLVDRTLRYA